MQDFVIHWCTRLAFSGGWLYRRCEKPIRCYVGWRSETGYDDRIGSFESNGADTPGARHYERALRRLWEAEIEAPGPHLTETLPEEGPQSRTPPAAEGVNLIELASSPVIRSKFQSSFSPREREGLFSILSLLAHGEAYALHISSTLLASLEGTGSKLRLSAQVVEEARHFAVMKALLETLWGKPRPLYPSARILLELIARSDPFTRLFGLNVLMETFALQIFSRLPSCAGLDQILQSLYRDETRHCAFPREYARLGYVPATIRCSTRYRLRRTRFLVLTIPVVLDYRPDFEALGIDTFEFFGSLLRRILRSAEKSHLPILPPAEGYLALTNLSLNAYLKRVEPERYEGFEDYCGLATFKSSGSSVSGPQNRSGSVSASGGAWKLYESALQSIDRIDFAAFSRSLHQ